MRSADAGVFAGLVAIALMVSGFIAAAAAWITHVIACIKAGAWILLALGCIVAPVGIVHGVGLWLGVF